MINKVILVGRLTADPDAKTSAKGTQVTKVRVATNTYSGKDDEGNRREHTEFHSLVLFGRHAQVAGEYLHKGSLVYVEGRLQTNKWDDSEGKSHSVTEVIVDSFQILTSKAAAAA